MSAARVIEVMRAGVGDLVMDSGRYGVAHLGVPVGGAADVGALQVANRLVGNVATAAGLEITLKGPVLAFPQGGTIALTGAPFVATRSSGDAITWNTPLRMAPEEQLILGAALSGCRCWLAVQGGIDVAKIMASRSTLAPAGFGGMAGRALHTGDALAIGERQRKPPRSIRYQPAVDDDAAPLRVISGPQASCFTDTGLAAFFTTGYRVDAASDRRGLRLVGLPVTVAAHGNIVSQAVLPGAIQIPPDGQPIILGWDGPVTGGYPVIAGLISADLPRMAQLKPGDTVRFETVSVDTACTLALARRK